MTVSIAFLCKCCGEEASPIRSDGGPAGFDDCADWLAPSGGPDLANPLLLEQAPDDGAEHWLTVRFPFHATAEAPFWCLFKPPLSRCNGWEDCPQEIAQSSLIRCRLLEATDVQQAAAKIRVAVECVLPLAAIGRELPVVDGEGVWFDWLDYHHVWLSRSGRFTHVSFNVESDAGCWFIVERRDEGDRLILDGEWSWHTSCFRACNRPLSERAVQAIKRIDALRMHG
ncbi:MAG: hypothetical protein M3N38_08170 [Pseudomonadota bacterium]|nr:hypothetical protein [Pseudomonadota bacterium]